MTEYDFREKTINDLYNEKLTKDEKIKKINRRCNKEEISNHRRIDKIKRDKILENLENGEIIRILKKEKKFNIVLDNYRVHKTKLVEKIAEILNINLIFLPPYSPDLNPIEDIWRNIKGIISRNNYKDENKLKKDCTNIFEKIIGNTSFFENWIKQFLSSVTNNK